VLAECLPLTPTGIRSAARFTPAPLHVADGIDVITALARLHCVAAPKITPN
jgi:hypothetical protein